MTTLRGPDPYAEAEDHLSALFVTGEKGERFYAPVCAILHETMPTYTWVGIYRVEEPTLVLDAWSGSTPPAAQQIPIPSDLGGTSGQEPLVRNDAKDDPLVNAFVAGTRAVTIQPLRWRQKGAGALVIASAHRGAFGPADRALLTLVAARLNGEHNRT